MIGGGIVVVDIVMDVTGDVCVGWTTRVGRLTAPGVRVDARSVPSLLWLDDVGALLNLAFVITNRHTNAQPSDASHFSWFVDKKRSVDKTGKPMATLAQTGLSVVRVACSYHLLFKLAWPV